MGAVADGLGPPLLVMELMKLGSLWEVLRNPSVKLDGSALRELVLGVIRGMSFLHACNPVVIHGDLKSANVLVSDKLEAKIADFGLCQKLGSSGGSGGVGGASSCSRSARGIGWTAPECLCGQPASTASDVYSFGVTLFEILSRSEPYQDEDPTDLLPRLRAGTVTLLVLYFYRNNLPRSID